MHDHVLRENDLGKEDLPIAFQHLNILEAFAVHISCYWSQWKVTRAEHKVHRQDTSRIGQETLEEPRNSGFGSKTVQLMALLVATRENGKMLSARVRSVTESSTSLRPTLRQFKASSRNVKRPACTMQVTVTRSMTKGERHLRRCSGICSPCKIPRSSSTAILKTQWLEIRTSI